MPTNNFDALDGFCLNKDGYQPPFFYKDPFTSGADSCSGLCIPDAQCFGYAYSPDAHGGACAIYTKGELKPAGFTAKTNVGRSAEITKGKPYSEGVYTCYRRRTGKSQSLVVSDLPKCWGRGRSFTTGAGTQALPFGRLIDPLKFPRACWFPSARVFVDAAQWITAR